MSQTSYTDQFAPDPNSPRSCAESGCPGPGRHTPACIVAAARGQGWLDHPDAIQAQAELDASKRVSHTPGPWSLRHESGVRSVIVQRGQEGGFVVIGTSAAQELADGRLLAAAPELLAALQMFYTDTADYIRINNLGGMNNQNMRAARAAIAKATGDAAAYYSTMADALQGMAK